MSGLEELPDVVLQHIVVRGSLGRRDVGRLMMASRALSLRRSLLLGRLAKAPRLRWLAAVADKSSGPSRAGVSSPLLQAEALAALFAGPPLLCDWPMYADPQAPMFARRDGPGAFGPGTFGPRAFGPGAFGPRAFGPGKPPATDLSSATFENLAAAAIRRGWLDVVQALVQRERLRPATRLLTGSQDRSPAIALALAENQVDIVRCFLQLNDLTEEERKLADLWHLRAPALSTLRFLFEERLLWTEPNSGRVFAQVFFMHQLHPFGQHYEYMLPLWPDDLKLNNRQWHRLPTTCRCYCIWLTVTAL